MLQRDDGKPDRPIRSYTYLLAVEIQDGVNREHVSDKIVDALTWFEGVGKTEITCLGEMLEEDVPEATSCLENA